MSKKFEEYQDDILKLRDDTICKLREIADKHNQSLYLTVKEYNFWINALMTDGSLFTPLKEDKK